MSTVATILALLIIALVIFVATRPDDFRIERATVINAPAHTVFALISDFHAWEAWSPWEKIDPQLTRSYAGPSSGKGAIYEWSGNKKIGQGRMEIAEAIASSALLIKLDFITPFEAHNMVEFTLLTQGNTTVVTQAMFGPSPLISKLMSLVFNMEKMVGPKYEEGLARLKALAEQTTARA
jgi:Polyketide cyclase / dehydrase and lipid transport